jgi:prolyl-tRNA synthetase
MGVIAEKFSDDKGLVWPDNIAQAKVYLARLGDNADVVAQADKLYDCLTAANVSVLYDDRDLRPGEKFADADLYGIPYRIVVSDKTVAAGTLELKERRSTEAKQLSESEVLKTLGVAA